MGLPGLGALVVLIEGSFNVCVSVTGIGQMAGRLVP